MEHNEIENTMSHFHDKNYLNNKGVKIFAKDLKKGYFKFTKTRTKRSRRTQLHENIPKPAHQIPTITSGGYRILQNK